jgi:hypothetical protein
MTASGRSAAKAQGRFPSGSPSGAATGAEDRSEEVIMD